MGNSEEIIIKGLASGSPVSLLLDEYKKTNSIHTKNLIEEELTERGSCPECDNNLFFDSGKSEFYCPRGCKL